MTTAHLVFDLEEPGDRDHLLLALEVHNLHAALEEMDSFLRNKLKYEELTDEQYKVYDHVRDHFWDILKTRDLRLY